MIRPKQRLPFKAKDATWVEQSARYFSSIMIYAVDRRYAETLYRAANGELDDEEYLYVTNPRHTNKERLTRFPSKLRNLDILSTNLMLFMGEKRRRGLDCTVVAINSDVEDLRKQILDQEVDKFLVQELMKEVIVQQILSQQQPNPQQDQQMTQADVQSKVTGVQDKLAIEAQATIDYIREHNNLDSKFVENFYHWLVLARCFTYAEPKEDEVKFYDVSPLEMKYLANSRVRFMKYAEAVERFVRMPLSQVIDEFQGVKGFTEDIIKQLEQKQGYAQAEGFSTPGGISWPTDIDFISLRSPWRTDQMWNKLSWRRGWYNTYSETEGVFVQHVVWTSMCKRAQITIPNMFGEPEKIWVDEDYIEQAGEDLDWVWKRQKWHAYIIDDRFVVGGEPLEYTTEGDGECVNPYDGRIFNLKHVNPKSVVERGLEYQIKYNIIHYHIEKMFAKYEGDIMVIPLSLISETEDLGMDETLYYADATGKLFVDDSKKNAQTALNGLKILNTNLGTHINQLYEYLKIVRDEWDNLVGVTPQRKGIMNASDGKGTTDNSVFRSSIMSEELFMQYEELEESVLNQLLELGKVAFADGKKAMFIRGTKYEQALIDLDPETFCYGKYLIKVKNSGRNLEELSMAKQQAQALTQNKDGRFSDVIKVIRAGSIAQLEEEMLKVEANFDQQQQAQQQAQQQLTLQVEENKKDVANINAQASGYHADRVYDATVEAATIRADATLDISKFNDPSLAPAEIAQLDANSIKRQELQTKTDAEREKLRSEDKRNQNDNDTKRYVADKYLEASKANKKKSSE